jgi:hypothetical protein
MSLGRVPLLGRLSRFIYWMRSLRSSEAKVIFRMDGRLFGGWIGVFTMPQEEMAVCSIIPYIYLDEPRSRRS